MWMAAITSEVNDSRSELMSSEDEQQRQQKPQVETGDF